MDLFGLGQGAARAAWSCSRGWISVFLSKTARPAPIQADDQTNPQITSALVGLVHKAGGRAHVPGRPVPATAAQNKEMAELNTHRIGYILSGILPIPGLTPLPHVAVHVVQAPSIGREAANRGGLPAVWAIFSVPIGLVTVVVSLLWRTGLPIRNVPTGTQANSMPIALV